MNRPTDRYGLVVIGTHWLMLVLIIAAYVTAEFNIISAADGAAMHLHFQFGLLLLPLLALRLIGRAVSAVPPIVPALPAMQLKIADFIYIILSLFMLAMPILGWMILDARGEPVTLFGPALPGLIDADADHVEALMGWHRAIGYTGYALIALHTLGTLFHRYFVKDNTLTQMLPLATEAKD